MFWGVPLAGRSFRYIFFAHVQPSCKVLETLQDRYMGPSMSQKRMPLQ